MSRWFRHYAGLARDEKLVSVAIKAKQPVERVVWVWAAILESAAEIDDNGRYALDTAEAAYFLRTDEADICAIISGLSDAGRVHNGVVVNWGNRQFQSDRSKERVAAHRERKRQQNTRTDTVRTSQNTDVTLQKRHGNTPETELDTDTEDASATDARATGSALVQRLVASLGPLSWCGNKHHGLHVLSDPLSWLSGGCDLELDVLPAITAKAHRMAERGDEPRSWRIFADDVFRARDRRLAPSPPVQQRAASPPQSVKPHPNQPLMEAFARIARNDPSNPDYRPDPPASGTGIHDFGGSRTIDAEPALAIGRRMDGGRGG